MNGNVDAVVIVVHTMQGVKALKIESFFWFRTDVFLPFGCSIRIYNFLAAFFSTSKGIILEF